MVTSQSSPYLTCKLHWPPWCSVPGGLHLTLRSRCSPSISPISLAAFFSSSAGSYSASWALYAGVPSGTVLGPHSFSIYIHFYGDPIQSYVFQYCLSAERVQIWSPPARLRSNCILNISFRSLIDMSNLTSKTEFLIFPPNLFFSQPFHFSKWQYCPTRFSTQ